MGTEWGLLRHNWIVAKVVLTVPATIILLLHMPAVSRISSVAARGLLSGGNFGALRTQLLVHAVGGLLVLFAATVLSVYKPWGMTPYGRRKLNEQRRRSMQFASPPPGPTTTAQITSAIDMPFCPSPTGGATAAAGSGRKSGPRWTLYAAVALIAFIALVVLHLAHAGLSGH
jgi:hypothetical protein